MSFQFSYVALYASSILIFTRNLIFCSFIGSRLLLLGLCTIWIWM